MNADSNSAFPASAPAGGAPARRRRWAVALLVALAAVVGVAWWRQRDPQPPSLALEHADPAVREAITAARGEVVSHPRSPAAWGRLGAVLLVHDYADAASAALAQAARLDADEARWPYLHARALFRDPDAALPRLETAVRLCHDRPVEPRLRLAELLFELGRVEEAAAAFQAAAHAAPDHPRVQLGLGRLALERQDWPGAVKHLEAAVATPFARQQAAALLAIAYRRLPEHADKAAAAAAQAQTPPPDRSFDALDPFVQEMSGLGVGKNHRLARAENLQLAGNLREAAAVLHALTVDYPTDPWVHIRLAEVMLRGEDWRGAAAAARQALARDPRAAQAHFFWAVATFHDEPARDLDAVVQALRQATKLNPNHGYAHNYLGLALRESGRRAEAHAAFLAASRCYPAFADPQFHLADLWTESGLLGPACMHVQQALRFAPRQNRRLQESLGRLALAAALRPRGAW